MRALPTAVRFLLLEQSRNRLAVVLLVAFIPTWYLLFQVLVPHDPLPVRLRATGHYLSADGLHISLLTAGLNAITLIVGFTVFTATRRGIAFDHRLVLCGFRQPVLLLAKLVSLVTVCVGAALYATLALLAFWRPDSALQVFIALATGGLAYGSLGLLLGLLLRGDLEGLFVIIMLSLIDTSLQNPLGNPVANRDFLVWLPSYAPTQLAVAGGFTHQFPLREVAFSLAWPLGFAAVAMLVLWLRTRVPGRVRQLAA